MGPGLYSCAYPTLYLHKWSTPSSVGAPKYWRVVFPGKKNNNREMLEKGAATPNVLEMQGI